MRYASVCSGVEAASLAWGTLGWEPVWFSEIEPFPCAVLATRFPDVPNLGDMTKIEGEKYHGAVDLLVGGTPCQDVSVAGKRKGFAGERSGLALSYISLLATMRPSWFVWENVPGVLSSNGGEDFKAFIRSADEVGYSCAWRVLDAQYVRVDGFPRAVPQRRRRVFVVGHLGTDWRYPASVLFEPEGLPRNTPPRRVKGKGFTTGTAAGAGTAKWRDGGDRADTLTCTSHNQLMPDKARLQCVLDMRQAEAQGCDISPTLIATDYKGGKAISFYPQRKAESMVPLEECSNTLVNGTCPGHQNAVCFDNQTRARNPKETGDICCTLQAAMGTSGNNTPLVVRHDSSPCADRGMTIVYENHPQDSRIKECETPTLTAGNCGHIRGDTPLVQAVAIAENVIGRRVENGGNGVGAKEDVAYTQNCTGVMGVSQNDTVRRLTPVECERLMGFPDNWTRIPWKLYQECVRKGWSFESELEKRGKKLKTTVDDCPDSPRYKACGNSMCVNVMRWIGMRIELVERNETHFEESAR